MAQLLKPLGYATGQFGKNHLGDLDEHLPTAHGFDEFFGILDHLNAGEYVEEHDFPRDPEVAAQFAQRGIIHSFAQPDGTQRIEDLGNFGRERQRTLDQEVLEQSLRFIRDAAEADRPFFVWHNTTRMHCRTNLSEEYEGRTGLGIYADGMAELDDAGQVAGAEAEARRRDRQGRDGDSRLRRGVGFRRNGGGRRGGVGRKVYRPDIVRASERLYKKPGYTM